MNNCEATKEQEDSILVRDLKNGSSAAYDALVKKYGPRLYYVINGMTRDHKTTDDLLQETFIRLYYSIHTYNEKFPFYPWLYRIAVNLTINHLKKKSRIVYSIEGDEIQVDSETKGSSIPRDMSNPEIVTQNNELFREVGKALQKLPPAMRAVFALRTFDDRSYSEISQILNCSIGTVMSRLNRARDKMKKLLSGYLGMDGEICADYKEASV